MHICSGLLYRGNKMNGFIKLHRQIVEWGWYKDPNTKALFLHLLLTANFRPREYMGHKLQPGQTVVGRKALAETLGITENQVRTAMDHLRQTGEITTKATNRFTIVTIEKWESYQLKDDEITNKPPADNQQTTNRPPHLKNEKNDKNEKKEVGAGECVPEPVVNAIPMPDDIRQKMRKLKYD